jgi:hypothetical protein
MNLLAKTTIQVSISLFVAATLFTYFYPWLYNKINHITERGEDIDETIDYVNSLIMFAIAYIIMILITTVVTAVVVAVLLKKKKIKINK